MLATATRLWALRYPATHELHMLARPAGGTGGGQRLDARSSRIHARSEPLAERAAVVVASEQMDDDPGWRALDPGELLEVDSDLAVRSGIPVPSPPRHLLQLADLDAKAASSQHPQLAAR